MYNVLLVDDELSILEGISSLVDWQGCGTRLIGQCRNGQLAVDFIMKNPPDIVITDIKMPNLNGVEMIKRIYPLFPAIKYIILSGYNEFDFAKTAMQYGVKHYLLKPSNEVKIEEALKQIIEELEEQKQKDQFVAGMKTKLQNVLPIAKEQFLKEFITDKKYEVLDWEYFSQLFEIRTTSEQFKLLVLEIDGEHDFETIFALKEIVTEKLSQQIIHLCTTIGERIVMLCENHSDQELIEMMKPVQELFANVYRLDFTTAISHAGSISQLRKLYHEALDCLTQRFYLGHGSIISAKDMSKEKLEVEPVQLFDHEDLIFAIRSGNLEELNDYLQQFFERLQKEKLEVNVVKSHCLELFMSILRQSKKETRDNLFQKIIFFQEFHTLEQIKQFIETISREIALQNYDRAKESQCEIIQNVIKYVEENFADETLTLSKIANEVFYMNPDYIGKLFKKETGTKFSSYLVNLRVEKAIELIETQAHEGKMLEIAEAVGFGQNPRYFGKVFKKYTGFTPTEYKNQLPTRI
ncbi:response regulator [Metabacillus sp. Hm71]|uniref:response regulator n=1 Tax=Metabacillus sp. Hm71 TaxID=3450743 RepID=UPI003F4273DC